MLRRVDC